jgi:hypothetical protein
MTVYIDGVALGRDRFTGQPNHPFDENRVLRVSVTRGAMKDNDVPAMNTVRHPGKLVDDESVADLQRGQH